MLCIIQIILGAILPLFGIYLPKLAIDLATEQASMERVVQELLGFTLLMVLTNGICAIANNGKYHLYNSQRTNLIGLLFLKSLRVKYEYTESGEMKKNYWKALDTMQGGDWCSCSRTVTETVNLITSILCFCLYSTVIGTLSLGMLLIIIALAFIGYIFDMCHIHYGKYYEMWKAQAQYYQSS